MAGIRETRGRFCPWSSNAESAAVPAVRGYGLGGAGSASGGRFMHTHALVQLPGYWADKLCSVSEVSCL